MEAALQLLEVVSSLAWYTGLLMGALWLLKEVTMGMYLGRQRLDGRLVVVTGANCGIGLETARDLASRGATLVLGCRSRERGEAAVRDIVATTGNTQVVMEELDLLSLESVRRFAQTIASRPEPLGLLINNAGMADGDGIQSWAIGKSHLSNDGLELVTQTNHLSHFLLTNLLKDKLAAAGKARVINVSSIAAPGGKIDLQNINYESDSSPSALRNNYHNSKLMNVLFSKEISRRWGQLGITSYSNHPGVIRTEVFRHFTVALQYFLLFICYWVGKDCRQGAQTTLYLALEPGLESQAGSFFGDCRNWDFILNKMASDSTLASGLWERSAQLVNLDM